MVVNSGDAGSRARVDKVVGESLAQRREVLGQVRHADRGVERGLEGDVRDRTVDQVHAIDVDIANGRIVGPAVRAAQFGIFTQLAVAEQRDRDFAEQLLRLVADFRHIGTGVQEQQAVAGRGRAADSLGRFLAPFTAEGEADVTGTPEVPQFGGHRGDGLMLLVLFRHGDEGVYIFESFGRLVACAEDVQRGALRQRLATVFGVAQVATALVIIETGVDDITVCVQFAHRDALGIQQRSAANNGTGLTHHAQGVDNGIGSQCHTLGVNGTFDVLDFNLAVGVADVPRP